jgi:isoleucyl-tRNA synthetase
LSLLIAPMMPFLAEMLWRRLVDPQSSVHAQAFPASVDAWVDTDLEESMRMVARVVEMGRALRERASIKIRQPLARIHLRASHAHAVELLQRDFAREQILGELNIRDYGSVALDDGQLCVLKAKANFRTLGKRLGAKMKAAAAAIETLSSSEVARLRAGSSVSLDVAGETLSIGPTEVDVLVETRADFDLETDGRLVVYLDTALDDDLRAEGLYREAVSRINALRKERGYSVEDRIQLVLDARGHGLLTRSLAQHGSSLAEETLAASSLHTDTRGAPDAVALELDQDCVLYVRVAKL